MRHHELSDRQTYLHARTAAWVERQNEARRPPGPGSMISLRPAGLSPGHDPVRDRNCCHHPRRHVLRPADAITYCLVAIIPTTMERAVDAGRIGPATDMLERWVGRLGRSVRAVS